MSQHLVALQEAYSADPHSYITSNVPYAPVEGDAVDAAARKAARITFMEGEAPWPVVDYKQLDTPPLDSSIKNYQTILTGVLAIEASECETPESSVLYETTAWKLAEMYRHLEIQRLLGSVAVADKKLSRTRAGNMSEDLFGGIDGSIFHNILLSDVQQALDVITAPDDSRAESAMEFLRVLGVTPDKALTMMDEEIIAAYPELTAHTIETIKVDFFTLFPRLAKEMEPYSGRTGPTKAADAAGAFEAALRGMGVPWQVRMIAGSTRSAEALPLENEIVFGERHKDFTSQNIVTTPIHEATHAHQHYQMSQSPVPYRRAPLAGSAGIAEGLPVVIEQILNGRTRVPGEKYYLQLGLFLGLHLPKSERTEQSFRKVFDVMKQREVVISSDVTPEAIAARTNIAEYGYVMRTARGGARDHRDATYYSGAQQATRFMNETAVLPEAIRLERLRWILSGIFDPDNPAQVELYGGDPAARFLASKQK